MDALQVPSWAYDFCYYYAALAAIVVVYAVYTLFELFTLPATIAKSVPVTGIAISLILSSLVSVVLVMMQFWICRAALAPKEKFADKCDTDADCLDINGTQHCDRSMGNCGARKLCGGYYFNGDMKPSMLPEYSESLAGTMPAGY